MPEPLGDNTRLTARIEVDWLTLVVCAIELLTPGANADVMRDVGLRLGKAAGVDVTRYVDS